MSVVIVDPNQPIPESEYLWAKGIGQFDIDSNTRRKYFLSFLYPVYAREEHVLSPSVDNITLTDIVVNYLQIEEHELVPNVDSIELRSVEHLVDAPIESHELTPLVNSIELRSIVIESNAPVEQHELTPVVDTIDLRAGAVDSTVTENHELTPSVDSISLSADEVLLDKLFGQGQQGVWFDPSDLSTMFQDIAGTVPVTTDGDPIGMIMDKSGNGHHATASNPANFTYRTDGTLHWIEHPGVGIFSYTPSPSTGSSDVCRFGAQFRLTDPNGNWGCLTSWGDAASGGYVMLSSMDNISSALVVAAANLSGPTRVNGADFTGTRGDLYNELVSAPKVIGAVGLDLVFDDGHTVQFTGRYGTQAHSGTNTYGYIEYRGNLSQGVYEWVEQYLANKAGVTL